MINKLKIDDLNIELNERTKFPFTHNFTQSGVHNVKIGLDDTNEICAYAFKDCAQLTKVTFPSKINKIKRNAFENCTSLQSIDIPSTIDYIGPNVFDGCTNLKTINFESSTPPDFLSILQGSTTCYIPDNSKFVKVEDNSTLVKDGSIQYYTKNILGGYDPVDYEALLNDEEYYYDNWVTVHNHYNVLENRFKVPIDSIVFYDENVEVTSYTIITGNEGDAYPHRFIPANATNTNTYWLSSNPGLVSIDQTGHMRTDFGKIGRSTIYLCAEPNLNGTYAFAQLNVRVEKGNAAAYFSYENELISNLTLTSLSNIYYPKLNYVEDLMSWKQQYPNDNPTITYESSNPDVATVSNDGKLTLKDNGTTYISASLTGSLRYNNMTTRYTLTVKIDDFSKETPEIILSESEITINNKDNIELPTITNTNNVQLEYSSSNTDIVSIDKNTGNITLNKPSGTSIITVKTVEDNTYLSVSKTYTIIVDLVLEDATITCNGVGLDNNTNTFIYKFANNDDLSEPFEINKLELPIFEIDKDNVEESKLHYTSSNTNVATIDDQGIVTFVGLGTTTITLKIIDSLLYNNTEKSYILIFEQRSNSGDGSDGSDIDGSNGSTL